MHKTKESGAIAGGIPGVQELREGTLYCHLRCFERSGHVHSEESSSVCCPGLSSFYQAGKGPELKDRLTGFDSSCSQMLTDAIHWWTNHMGRKGQATEDTKETILFQKCCVWRGCSKTL